jgi:hypothetical protein
LNFIIVGGGCFGTFYVRQLLRGADRLGLHAVHIVDKDPECRAAREFASLNDPRLQFHISDWTDFLIGYFQEALARYERGEEVRDHYVPPTFAPHILLEIFLEIAGREDSSLVFDKKPFKETVGTPVDIALPAGTRALSFATWTCPAACIEPPTCPHTRGAKDWDMKEYLLGKFDSIHIFQCRHYAMGVGTIPVVKILEEYVKFREVVSVPGTHLAAMATVSSCHGLIGLVEARHA